MQSAAEQADFLTLDFDLNNELPNDTWGVKLPDSIRFVKSLRYLSLALRCCDGSLHEAFVDHVER
jgi:hypothetical protein